MFYHKQTTSTLGLVITQGTLVSFCLVDSCKEQTIFENIPSRNGIYNQSFLGSSFCRCLTLKIFKILDIMELHKEVISGQYIKSMIIAQNIVFEGLPCLKDTCIYFHFKDTIWVFWFHRWINNKKLEQGFLEISPAISDLLLKLLELSVFQIFVNFYNKFITSPTLLLIPYFPLSIHQAKY